jgi:CubicO group peptidase (beta-lactamase class C family)
MSSFGTDRLARIQGWMQGYVDARKYPGCAALIAQDGDEVFYHHCGLRDVENGLQWQRDTVARIYSMTKPITSAALMILVERGLVHLDAPLSQFIPGFSDTHCLIPGATSLDQVEPCATPTLHQLLTHTSGVSYSFNPGVLPAAMHEGKLDFGPGQKTLAEMADALAELPLAFHPGTRWEYSVGIDLIGRVIEVVSGQSFGDFLETEILKPLGMTDTRFTVAETAKDRFACLYTPLSGNSFDLNAKEASAEPLRLADGVDGSPYLNTKMQSGGGGLVGTQYAALYDA